MADSDLKTRQAALLIHGLAPAMRHEVMARLTPAESSRLKPLLEELTALGIGPSRDLPAEPPPRSGTPIERAGFLDAGQVLPVLERRDPLALGLLLQGAEWPWKPAVIGRFGHQTLGAPTPPAVLRVLCECLCRDAPEGRLKWSL